MRKYIVLLAVCIYSLVSDAQNVGVGVPNPQNKLHVGGGFRLDTLTGVGGSGLLWHNPNGVIYGTKFTGNTNDVLRGDGTFGPYNPAINGALGWLLTGNSGTNPATNFLGTTDNQPLLFRVNNIRHGYLNSNNIFFGSNAGLANTVNGNIGIGNGALQNNIEGLGLLAIGDSVLHKSSYGNHNTAIGSRSMYQNYLGSRNTALGYEALSKQSEGDDNTAVGYQALFQNSGFDQNGRYNTAVGSLALAANTRGSANTATGYRALGSVQSGGDNSGFGFLALMNNTSSWNSAFGANALASNTTGFANNAFGRGALYNNTSGRENVAIGTNALFNNETGVSNTAIGYNALNLNTHSENSALGHRALSQNSSGFGNNAFGVNALTNNKDKSYNSAFGNYALTASNAYYNSAFGFSALRQNTTGEGNTGFGMQTLYNNITGSYNTAVGFGSGSGLPNNVFNVTCIGYDVGWNTTISNQVNIGNKSVSWIGGQVQWSTYSDKRMKHDISEDVPGLAFIIRLKPVTYLIDIRKQEEIANAGKKINSDLSKGDEKDWKGKYDIEKIKMTGFIAQDVEDAARSINYSFNGVHNPKNGGLYSLEYSSFVVPLVKAVQEQQKIIEDQNNKLDKQQQQIDLLIKEMQSLKKDLITQKN